MAKKTIVGNGSVSVVIKTSTKFNPQFYWEEFQKLTHQDRLDILAGIHDSHYRDRLPVNFDCWFYDTRAQDLIMLWAENEFDVVATKLKWKPHDWT